MSAETDPEPRADGDSDPGDSDPRVEDSDRLLVYLAAERTILTWIRAAIAFMVLGFAVDRFGLLLARNDRGDVLASPVSSSIGIALIGAGVLASAVAAVRYQRFAARYARGDVRSGSGLPLAIGLACLLVLLGSGLAAFTWLSAG